MINNESTVKGLIKILHKLKLEKSYLLKNITNYPDLIKALEELDSLVELDNLKNSIVSQIKFLIINTSNKHEKFDGHMLHTVLYGPPGVGKTRVCTILAKIWLSLGLLTSVKTEKDKIKPILKIITKKLLEVDSAKSNNSTIITNNNDNPNRDIINKLRKELKTLKTHTNSKNKVIENLQNHCSETKNNVLNLKQHTYDIAYKIRQIKRDLNNLVLTPFSTSFKLIEEILNEVNTLEESLTDISSFHISDEYARFTYEIIEDLNNDSFADMVNEVKKDLIKPPVTDNNPPVTQRENNDDNLIRIVGREDFVGGYLGQTAMKTEKLLTDSLGKILFIDEAYALVNDEKDSYGREALTVLNRFMSEHSSEIVVIFAGYKELMEQTIFKYQPGLKRRCTWAFEINGYSAKGLSQIFTSQLAMENWALDTNINLTKFFNNNLKHFTAFGGDTLRLCFYCKICFSESVFDIGSLDQSYGFNNSKIINKTVLEKGLEFLKKYKVDDVTETISPHHHSIYL